MIVVVVAVMMTMVMMVMATQHPLGLDFLFQLLDEPREFLGVFLVDRGQETLQIKQARGIVLADDFPIAPLLDLTWSDVKESA